MNGYQKQNPTSMRNGGFNGQSMATSWLWVIFMDSFLCSSIKLQLNEMQ